VQHSVQRPAVTVEILANLVRMFRQTNTRSEKFCYYLDWAAKGESSTIRNCMSELGRVPVTNPPVTWVGAKKTINFTLCVSLTKAAYSYQQA
jgi:hypothetical protein